MHTHQTSRFTCPQYHHTFARYADVRRHNLTSHQVHQKRHKCPQCNFISLRRDSVTRHLTRIHGHIHGCGPNIVLLPTEHSTKEATIGGTSPRESTTRSDHNTPPATLPRQTEDTFGSQSAGTATTDTSSHPMTEHSDKTQGTPERSPPELSPPYSIHSWTSPSVMNYLEGRSEKPLWWSSREGPARPESPESSLSIPTTPGGSTPEQMSPQSSPRHTDVAPPHQDPAPHQAAPPTPRAATPHLTTSPPLRRCREGPPSKTTTITRKSCIKIGHKLGTKRHHFEFLLPKNQALKFYRTT